MFPKRINHNHAQHPEMAWEKNVSWVFSSMWARDEMLYTNARERLMPDSTVLMYIKSDEDGCQCLQDDQVLSTCIGSGAVLLSFPDTQLAFRG